MAFVLSTMTNSVNYAFWDSSKVGSDPGKNGLGALPVLIGEVLIRGGANMSTSNPNNIAGERSKQENGTPIWTPAGVVTEIPDELVPALEKHPTFAAHQEQGLVSISENSPGSTHKDIVRATQDMAKSDGFAPLDKAAMDANIAGKKIKVTTGNEG